MTAPLWLPGATIVKANQDGGSMLGNDAYVTWHTFECDYSVKAVVGARALNAEGFAVHIVFHPITGDIVAMIPANRAGRGLMNEAGGVETNRQGRANIQIEVIARASRPWTKDLTADGRAGLKRLLAWLDDLGVPRTAPNGYVGPASYAASTKRARSVAAWNGPGGYFCHADVPENDHWDHGPIDMRDLWAATATQSEEDDMQLNDIVTVTRADGKGTEDIPFKTLLNRVQWLYANAIRQVATEAAQTAAIQALAESKGADADAITKAVVDKIAALQITLTPKES